MIDKLASTGVIVGASATAATAASASPSPLALIAPIAVACLAASFSRAISIFGPSSRKDKVWAYEIAVVAFCVLLSGALAFDHQWTVGEAASYGGGIGFVGAGLKPLLETLVRSLFASIAAAAAKNDPPE